MLGVIFRLQKKDFPCSHELTFLAIKTRGNVFKRFLLSQTQAKTPMESIGTIFLTIRRLKVASSENEEKLDFQKKPIQTKLIKHFYTGHEVRFLTSKTGKCF